MRVMQRGVGPDEDDRRPLAIYVPRVCGGAWPEQKRAHGHDQGREGDPSGVAPMPGGLPASSTHRNLLPPAQERAGGAGPPAARGPPPLFAKAYFPERMRGGRAAARFFIRGVGFWGAGAT